MHEKSGSINEKAEMEKYHGPLPSPEVLKRYEEILPGATERIFRMVERQAQHRQNIENRRERGAFWLSLTGQMCGLIVGLSAILGGVYCIANGRDYSGSALGLSAIIGLISVFVLGRRGQRQLYQESPVTTRARHEVEQIQDWLDKRKKKD